MKGTRADIRLFELGLAKSREKAKSLIMAGSVFCDGVRVSKAGDLIKEDSVLTVKSDPIPYVSRGGLKLEKALNTFPVSVTGKVAADFGASSGGFTDCMLKNGAVKVYAVDVGYGQLDWSLRNDERVVVMERTNAREMTADWFSPPLDFATLDLSFISVRLILLPLFRLIEPEGEIIVLVKPQFEAGREQVGKNGVVRSEDTHFQVLSSTALFALEHGFDIVGMSYSPITGPKGNIEFLLALKNRAPSITDTEVSELARSVVYAAHTDLKSIPTVD